MQWDFSDRHLQGDNCHRLSKSSYILNFYRNLYEIVTQNRGMCSYLVSIMNFKHINLSGFMEENVIYFFRKKHFRIIIFD